MKCPLSRNGLCPPNQLYRADKLSTRLRESCLVDEKVYNAILPIGKGWQTCKRSCRPTLPFERKLSIKRKVKMLLVWQRETNTSTTKLGEPANQPSVPVNTHAKKQKTLI
jgi:hypothetical protein